MDELPATLKAAKTRAQVKASRANEPAAGPRSAPPCFDLEAAEGTRKALIDLFASLRVLILRLTLQGPPGAQLVAALEAAQAQVAGSFEMLYELAPQDPSFVPVLEELKQALVEEARALEAAIAGDRARALDLEASARDRAKNARLGTPATGASTEAPPEAAFDRLTGRSRYDAHDEPEITYPLRCPRESCGEPGRHTLPPSVSTHRLRCPSCEIDFAAYVGVVSRATTERSSQAITHEVRTRDFTNTFHGTERTLRFEETLSPHPLPLAEQDLIVVIYDDDARLCIVKNLTRGGEVWIAPRSRCFVVTAATSPDAPEVKILRTFRDERLVPHRSGRLLIAAYEAMGPGIARWILRGPARRRHARWIVQALAAATTRLQGADHPTPP